MYYFNSPFLVFQFPVPLLNPEKSQNSGTELKSGEAMSPTSVQLESHPPSDDEFVAVECDKGSDQDSSMVQLHKFYTPH